MPNKKQVQFKLVPKIHVYRTIADPKPRVEIVCAKQVVGLCVRQAMMMLRNVPDYAACTDFNKLEAENRLSKHADMTVVRACWLCFSLWLWFTKGMIMIRSI